MVDGELAHLEERLGHIRYAECQDARSLVAEARRVGLEAPDALHALYGAVWEHISQALDHEDHEDPVISEVRALESEMAGRVLSYRLHRGWLVRGAEAPTSFRPITDYLYSE